jgi:hypothetical protein
VVRRVSRTCPDVHGSQHRAGCDTVKSRYVWRFTTALFSYRSLPDV